MSNLLFNIRFGATHLFIARDKPYIWFNKNTYWVMYKPSKWFAVYCWFGRQL